MVMFKSRSKFGDRLLRLHGFSYDSVLSRNVMSMFRTDYSYIESTQESSRYLKQLGGI